MIVYVETNFLLELAYLQESYESCREILRLAESEAISLVLPACCVTESYLTWHRKNSERQQFHTQLQTYLGELSRSAPFRGLADEYREVMTPLIAGTDESRDRLVAAIATIEANGDTIPLTAQIIYMVGFHESSYSLSPQDALVLASVKSHSEQQGGAQCFVTRDRGFGKSKNKHKIREELRSQRGECRVIFDFDDALAYIKNALSEEAES